LDGLAGRLQRRLSLAERHLGQTGFSAPITSVSKSVEHASQVYSMSGMANGPHDFRPRSLSLAWSSCWRSASVRLAMPSLEIFSRRESMSEGNDPDDEEIPVRAVSGLEG